MTDDTKDKLAFLLLDVLPLLGFIGACAVWMFVMVGTL